MNEAEATKLVKFVQALNPYQKIDENTALAWRIVMDDISFNAAFEAVKTIMGRGEKFLGAADIIQQVKRDRRNRTDAADDSFEFAGDSDNSVSYIEQLRAHRRAVGDGLAGELPALERAKAVPALENVFHSVNSDERPNLRLISSTPTPSERSGPDSVDAGVSNSG